MSDLHFEMTVIGVGCEGAERTAEVEPQKGGMRQGRHCREMLWTCLQEMMERALGGFGQKVKAARPVSWTDTVGKEKSLRGFWVPSWEVVGVLRRTALE